MMKIVSWNCRGMGSKVKEEATRSLLRREAPDILLIQETKMEDNEFLQISKNLWKGSSGQAVSARGALGVWALFGILSSSSWYPSCTTPIGCF
jgi:exonuclease III